MKGITVKSGSVRVRIFTSRSGKYVRHELRWTDHHGRRRRLKRSSLAEARREAQGIAEDLARGHHRSELSLADLASFRAGIVNLYGTGKTLELATAEYAECHKLLFSSLSASRGEGQVSTPSLKDLAAFWLANHRQQTGPLPVADAVARLLEAKTQQGVSPRWLGSLKSQLKKFATAHPLDIQCLTAPEVRQWAYGLRLGARARNNHLAAVKLLFNLGELRNHRERQSILDIPAITVTESTNALWTPDEFRRLLHAAPAHLLPVLVLGGFAKLRSSEIMRIESGNLKLEESRLMLRAGQTKTRRWRIVPLPECAVAWLRAGHLADTGKLWPWGSQKFNADLRKLAVACGLRWRPNALRNSAITYDQINNPDVARVAREAGNSAGVVETEYFALHGVTKATAAEWFAIYPPAQTRIIVPMIGQK